MPVVTIPGPCAAVAALTLAGLPTDRFLFAGFLPPKQKARADTIAEVTGVRATLGFLWSGPRLSATLLALAEGLGGSRGGGGARNLQGVRGMRRTGSPPSPPAMPRRRPGRDRGGGRPPEAGTTTAAIDADAALAEALTRLPPAQAANEVAKATGLSKRDLYACALAMKRHEDRRVAEARGRAAEDEAAAFLGGSWGWTVLAERVRTRAGEVDLIVRRRGSSPSSR